MDLACPPNYLLDFLYCLELYDRERITELDLSWHQQHIQHTHFFHTLEALPYCKHLSYYLIYLNFR